MALNSRILQVDITLPSTGQVVTIDQTLDLRAKVHKFGLSMNNTAEVTVFNLPQSMRQTLLSQFTAFNVRQIKTGDAGLIYCPITIRAGYQSNTNTAQSNGNKANSDQSIVIFSGYVIECDPVDAPPNVGVTIKCAEHQLDKTNWITGFAPTQTTFYNYVQWAASQMGVDRFICDTSYNDTVITNPSAATHHVGDLLVDIQNAYRPNVTAFIDNNVLIVKDQNKVISSLNSATLDEFVGVPSWTEYGITATTLFNQAVQTAGAVTINSKMNPSLNRTYVVGQLEYDLTSRDEAFYGTFQAYPPA